ncbi:hypothetical protein QIH12_26445, partial [Klebsiella pneumoniae]|nr:hypothetical protein [Klebsiella pneumoniae]
MRDLILQLSKSSIYSTKPVRLSASHARSSWLRGSLEIKLCFLLLSVSVIGSVVAATVWPVSNIIASTIIIRDIIFSTDIVIV